MSDAKDSPAGSVDPALDINETIIALPSHTVVQDLSSESLLASAPRTSVSGRQVPMVGGIPLLAKLGQGGMGAVYLGFHPRLKVEVAVKILPTNETAQLSAMVQRFFREGQLAAKVKSPHLVGVLDVNRERGLFYLVLDYISGSSAGNYLRSVQQAGAVGLDEATALSVCLAATEGLRCAHLQNVIHRDVKPDNILIPRDQTSGKLLFELAKLADLGLARASDGDFSLTNVDTTLGTPGFLAPEQATDAKHAGKPADIFAMGATLYTLLCGRPPFLGKTAVAAIVESMQNPHPPVAQFRPDVSPALAQVIDRCLAKAPEQRYSDAGALFGALNDCRPTAKLESAPVHVGQLAPTTLKLPVKAGAPTAARGAKLYPQIFSVPPAPKKLRWLALLAAPVLLCAAWLAWATLWRPEPKQTAIGKLVAPPDAADARRAELERQKAGAAKRQREAEELKALADKYHADAEAARLAEQRADEAVQRAAAAAASLETERVTERANDWTRTNKSLRDDLNNAQAAAQRARQQAQRSPEALRAAKQAEDKAKADADKLKQTYDAAQAALLQAEKEQKSCAETLQSDEQTLKQLQNNWPRGSQPIVKARENRNKANDALHQAREEVLLRQKQRQNAQAAWQNANQTYTATCALNRNLAEGNVYRDAADIAAADDAVRKNMAKLQDFELQDGPYTVETPAEIVLHDGRRNKDLTLSIFHPITAGADVFPVILFSHNFRAAKEAYAALCHYWASHGYVCIQPFHADAEGAGQKPEDLPQKPWADPLFLENRVRDLAFILDSLPALKEKIPALKTAINERAVGVSGAVLGACTVQLAAGVGSGLFDWDKIKALRDKRAGAVLLLSSPGCGVAGLASDSWKNFTLPLLNITGTKDGGANGQPYEWRKDPFLLSPNGDKYDLILEGAQHGLGFSAPENPGQRDAIKLASLNFWDAYLKNDASAKGYLRSAALAQYAQGKLTLDNK